MLQAIRERTQGWIAGTIIFIIILTFAFWGIHSYFIGGANNNIVATVNGIDITKEQLTTAFERMRRQVQTQYGASVLAQDDVLLKNRALKTLIDVEVLKHASNDQGFRISNGQVDNYLQSIPAFQVDGQFSLDRFQQILSSMMMSTNEFFELIRSSLLIDQAKLGIILTSYDLPDEVAYAIGLVNQERDISYIQVPLSFFSAQAVNISPDQIKNYYDAHKKDFMTPEKVMVEYIELSAKDLAVNIHPAESALKKEYNENMNSYAQPALWKLADIFIPVAANATPDQLRQAQNKAEEIIKNLSQGMSFAKIVTQNSSLHLAEKGMLSLNQMPAEFQKAVAAMTRVHQISAPIQTAKGIVILQVLDYKEQKVPNFDSVKDKVKESYIRQHAEEQLTEMRDQLADLTYEHPDTLKPAAKALHLPIKASEMFTRETPGIGISQYKKVRDAAFSNDVLNLQNNSEVLQLNPEAAIVLRVKTHVASVLQPLADMSNQISAKLKIAEANHRAAAFITHFLEKLQSGEDAIQLAKSNKLTWATAGYIGRYSTKVDPAVIDAAFRLPNPIYQNRKATYGQAKLANGYAIVALNAVKEGVTSSAKQAVFAEQIQNSEGILEYELYKMSQIKQAKIKLMS